MKLTVKQTSGEPLEVTECDGADDVSKLRATLAIKLSKKAEDIRIIFSGRILKDGKPLSEYKLKDGATLHAVVTSRPETKTAEPPAQPSPSSLFRPGGQRQPEGGDSDSGSGAGVPNMEQLREALSNPQILQQLVGNNPNIRPEDLRRLLSNPLVQARILREYQSLSSGGQQVPRAVFDDAIRLMNGERLERRYPMVQLSAPFPEIPIPGHTPSHRPRQQQQQQQAAPGSSSGGGSGDMLTPPRPLHEYVTRSQISDALRVALGDESSGRTDGDDGDKKDGANAMDEDKDKDEGKDKEEGKDKDDKDEEKDKKKEGGDASGGQMDTQADTTTQGATSTTTAAEGAAPPTTTPATGGGGQQPAAERYADQLKQLREMGFTDEQTCIQALERANGSINIALQFLFG